MSVARPDEPNWENKALLLDWIDQIIAELDLTAWEQDFIESIQVQLTVKGKLSEKQYDVLDRIYSRTS